MSKNTPVLTVFNVVVGTLTFGMYNQLQSIKRMKQYNESQVTERERNLAAIRNEIAVEEAAFQLKLDRQRQELSHMIEESHKPRW